MGKDNLFHRKKAHFQEGKNSNKGIFTKSRFFELMLLDFLSSKKEEERITRRGQKKKRKKKGIFNILTMTALKFSLFSRKDKKSSKHWLFHQK